MAAVGNAATHTLRTHVCRTGNVGSAARCGALLSAESRFLGSCAACYVSVKVCASESGSGRSGRAVAKMGCRTCAGGCAYCGRTDRTLISIYRRVIYMTVGTSFLHGCLFKIGLKAVLTDFKDRQDVSSI